MASQISYYESAIHKIYHWYLHFLIFNDVTNVNKNEFTKLLLLLHKNTHKGQY